MRGCCYIVTGVLIEMPSISARKQISSVSEVVRLSYASWFQVLMLKGGREGGEGEAAVLRDTSESASSGSIGLRESLTRDGAGRVDYHTSRQRTVLAAMSPYSDGHLAARKAGRTRVRSAEYSDKRMEKGINIDFREAYKVEREGSDAALQCWRVECQDGPSFAATLAGVVHWVWPGVISGRRFSQL